LFEDKMATIKKGRTKKGGAKLPHPRSGFQRALLVSRLKLKKDNKNLRKIRKNKTHGPNRFHVLGGGPVACEGKKEKGSKPEP